MRTITNASLYRTDGYRTIVSLQSGPVEITEAEIIQGSMTLDSMMIENEAFEIGNAISDQLMLTLDNSNGTYTSAFVGVEFDLYIAPFPVDGSISRENASWSQIGTFVCTQCDTSYADRITLTLNDRFVLMDQLIPAGTFAASKTLYQHLSAFCTTLGIGLSLTNTEQTFLQGITVVSTSSTADYYADMTYRDFVRGVAGIMWENAKMTATGSLAFRHVGASSIATTPSNRYNSFLRENVYVGPLSVMTTQGTTVYTAGTHDGQRLVLDETENRVVQLISPTMLSGYYGTLTVPGAGIIDMAYTPMEVTCLPFWEAEPGDSIVYTDKNGDTYTIVHRELENPPI